MKSFFQIKKALLDFFIVFISFSLILFYFYLRINSKQFYIVLIPTEIDKYYGIFLYFFFTSCFILALLLISTYLKNRKPKKDKKEIGIFGKLILRIAKIFSPLKVLYKAYSLVFHWISPIYMQHVAVYANNILHFSRFKNKLIIISAVVLPRILIVCVLIFEIYLKILHYYFFSLFLLLIPLIFRFVLFVYSDIRTQVIPKLDEIVERIPNTENVTLTINGKTETFGTIGYRFKPEYAFKNGKPQDLDHFMMTLYYPMLFIDPHMEVKILPLYHKYTSITILFYISVQIICWAYIIFLI